MMPEKPPEKRKRRSYTLEDREAVCEYCLESFTATSPKQRFCSEEHQRADHKLRYRWQPNSTFSLLDGRFVDKLNSTDTALYYDALAGDPCAYCGKPSEQTDHIVPDRAGGENDWRNYAAICEACNRGKRAYKLLAWLPMRELVARRRELRRELDELCREIDHELKPWKIPHELHGPKSPPGAGAATLARRRRVQALKEAA